MKKIIFLLAIFSLASCSISVNDEGVKIDGGDMGKIEAGDNGVVVDGGDMGKIEAGNSGVLLESEGLGIIEVGDNGVEIEIGESISEGLEETVR